MWRCRSRAIRGWSRDGDGPHPTLVKLVGAHLGIDATPYAADLAGAGWLPSEDQAVDVDEAAMLLAAVLAAPEPENEADALAEVPV